MSRRLILLLLVFQALLAAAPRRVLYVTATYGYRHSDSIEASVAVLQQLARESGLLEIDHTEDVSLLNADNLRRYDAVYFFTSGELPLSDRQKADLLDFVRSGKGFGGSHSATDCLYTWPEYGEMIGGYFDGHPWVQEAAVDVEDPQSPLVAAAAPAFRFTEEFYQFRAFSRDRVRVLLTLDTRSVDLTAPGITRTDGDFPLAWIRTYGQGRVFYSAFGHFVQSFQQPPVRDLLLKALLWLTGQIEADTAPRSGPSAPVPVISAGGVRPLSGDPGAIAPLSIVSVSGERLTSGSSWQAAGFPLPLRLAGTHVEVNGTPAPLFSVRPDQVLIQIPDGMPSAAAASLTISSVNSAAAPVPVRIEDAAPSILAAVRTPGALVLYVTGLGAVDPPVPAGAAAPLSPLSPTRLQPLVTVDGTPAPVFYSGLAPGFAGVYQVNAFLSPAAPASFDVVVEAAGRKSSPYPVRP